MWAWLASLFSGPIINGLLDAYRAKLDASNSQDAHAVDLAKAALQAEIEARKEGRILAIAEQERWWTALPRSLVQWSFAIFVAKCVLWDTVLGLGITEPLGGDIATWGNLVMGLWFGTAGLLAVTKAVFPRR